VCSSVVGRGTPDAVFHEHFFCVRFSLQACQPEGIATHPCTVRSARASIPTPGSLNFGNTKEIMALRLQGARTRLGVSSLSRALKHPALWHGERLFWWYWARREEGEGKGTGKIIRRIEMRRERFTSQLELSQLSAEPQISKPGTSTRLPAT